MAALAHRPRLSAGLAGAAAGLGQAPLSLAPLTLIGLALWAWLFLRTARVRQAAWLGWAFGTGYFAVTLHWIVEPFLVDAARHAWMAPFALAGLAGGLALFWGLASGVARALGHNAVILALTVALAETARSYILTGFPWALIGHVWIGWAPMHLAAWIGPLGLTGLTLLAPALAVHWRHRVGHLIAGGLVLASLAGLGAWAGRPGPPVAAEDRPILRLVQPNAPQHLKWDPDHIQTFFERQIRFTAVDATPRPDVIIWPETSVPTLLDYAEPAFAMIAEAAAGAPVVLGIQRRDGQGRFYNSLAVLDGTGAVSALYDKHHLVPFGEYIPAFGLLAALPFGSFVEEHGFGYTPGPGPQLLELGALSAGLGTALPLICYEAVFPQDVAAAPSRPDWLLQITNDAWFGNWVGPYQHLAQARLRAVEQGLPMVRVANTGVSAVIDAQGRIVAALPLNTQGYLDVALPLPRAATLYAQTGDLPVILIFCVALFGWAAVGRRTPIDAPPAQD